MSTTSDSGVVHRLWTLLRGPTLKPAALAH